MGMTRPAEKWKLVGGKIYRLAEKFQGSYDAIEYARYLKQTKLVFVTKTDDGQWAVYWREIGNEVDCTPELRTRFTEA
jgi:hypothetical protein